MEQDSFEQFDIKGALKLMEQGQVVSFYSEKRINYAFIKGGRIILSSENYKSPLSKESFIKLFDQTDFRLVEDEGELVDPLKDQEYYSWGRKM